ncbi:MAG: hypothetical protein LBO74_16885 [Candidatus Symbiothrix sp.]|jgi:hypothetical protein|nr:hypothetical protein [Candidatus Symbiothrix sp.]
MKTKQLAPIGADPVGSFIKSLPQESTVLATKCIRTASKAVIYITYFWEGEKVNTSFSWEGGPL